VAPFWLNQKGVMQTRPLFFALIAGSLFSAAGVWAQTVEGKVEIPRASAAGVADQRYQLNPEVHGGLPDPPTAVVYLEGAPSRIESPSAPLLNEMAQKNINFSPGILPIQVGTTVEFPNLDDTYHNVFSYSKAKRFDLGRYRKGEKPGVVLFDKPGVVTLHCEIHGSMRGTILVLDTPYFQKTDEQGRFRLESLPPGRYLLKAWVSEADVRVRSVELKEGATIHLDFPAK
jgi:plastocyanin